MFVVRRDIKSFYENVHTHELQDKLTQDTRTPRQVKLYLDKFFAQHCASSIGLPRGVGLSAILAELYMQEFDQDVRRIDGVYRYYRYCDDILLFLTHIPENLDLALAKILPEGMAFNLSKSRDHHIATTDGVPDEIEYLGYRFRVSDSTKGKFSRNVDVGIADAKIRRLKSRVLATFMRYTTDHNFPMLRDRIRYLFSNYIVHRNSNAQRSASHVRSGIYYNYKLCGLYGIKYSTDSKLYPPSLSELKAVDAFYHSLLTGPSSKFAPFLARQLTPPQLQELKKISAHKGHMLRMLVRFDPKDVAEIKRAWKNV